MPSRINAIAVIAFAIAMLASCNDDVAYHHYEKIADEGWDVRDTVAFAIDTIYQAGTYTSSVCVRTNATYPYRKISLMVYQTICHRRDSTASYSRGRTIVYTLPMEIKQEDGIATGQGVAYYSYEAPYATETLKPGDSIAVVVRHHMRREVLPGITDIGIKLERTE